MAGHSEIVLWLQSASGVCVQSLVMSDSLQAHGQQPARLLCPWGFPDKNTEVGCHFFLQGIFPTQEWNLSLLHLLHCRWILYHCTTNLS